jgi:uncharacterized membrane protein YdjX (TVP38/TMEM64 family)
LAEQGGENGGPERPGWLEALTRWAAERDWRKAGITSAAITMVALLLVAFFWGGAILGIEDEEGAAEIVGMARGTVWAPLVAIATFVVLAFAGFPQFLLIAAAVIAFGPLPGFAYSWIGTMVSAMAGFALGRLFGTRMMRYFSGPRLQALSERLGRRGFLASFIIRIVPSAPFVVINVTAGSSHISTFKFIAGTGLGIIPKMALIVFAGHGLMTFLDERDPVALTIGIVLIVLWIAAGVYVGRRLARRRR